jgi:hypothetical protein
VHAARRTVARTWRSDQPTSRGQVTNRSTRRTGAASPRFGRAPPGASTSTRSAATAWSPGSSASAVRRSAPSCRPGSGLFTVGAAEFCPDGVSSRELARARQFAWPRGSAVRLAARLGGGAPPRTTSGAAAGCGVRSLTSAIPPPWLARPGVKHPKNQNEDMRTARSVDPHDRGGRAPTRMVRRHAITDRPRHRIDVLCVGLLNPRPSPPRRWDRRGQRADTTARGHAARCPRRGTAAEPRGEATSRVHAARRTVARTWRSKQPSRMANKNIENGSRFRWTV